MTVTIPDVMRHVRNHFVAECLDGSWQLQDGVLLPGDSLTPGGWIAILDGPAAGVYQLDEYGAIPGAADAAWEGRICILTPPAGFIRLCCEIALWTKDHADPTLTGERFGEYSCTRQPTHWAQVFAPALSPYTRMYTEVNV